MSEEEQSSGEVTSSSPATGMVSLDSVLRIIADWEQDYFVPVSWPPSTKAHISQALAQLQSRIKALAS